MELDIYQVDAFARQALSGNPAAVIPLQAWLPDNLLQAMANENNLSETVYFVETNQGYHIRWFTPLKEVNLCGHATLAAAYVLFERLGFMRNEVVFESLSGELRVVKHANGWIELDFPSQPPEPCALLPVIYEVFHEQPIACLKAEDYIVVFEREDQVLDAQPNFSLLEKLDLRGVAITAQSSDYDFVTRFFAPKYGINEDPVTGSAFTQLTPYWARALKRKEFQAKQVSPRGGEVKCVLAGDRVKIYGQAKLYMQGRIYLEGQT